ncbi:hypothetical protein, conserved [Plasmodium gonderi]|uniref:Uncharacterized protein n=1 Tax=Plasmodium gonderi TaxID=77519 RepID=A0A1Y1JL42_PLAGO|nr:hypothetical protein, conserved [Plasmodium gonderi]GAW81927.1 hypothetical protein, conserved [Plasmodium gonderi]
MLKFLQDIDVAKKKILNTINNKFTLSSKNHDSLFPDEQEENMNHIFEPDVCLSHVKDSVQNDTDACRKISSKKSEGTHRKFLIQCNDRKCSGDQSIQCNDESRTSLIHCNESNHSCGKNEKREDESANAHLKWRIWRREFAPACQTQYGQSDEEGKDYKDDKNLDEEVDDDVGERTHHCSVEPNGQIEEKYKIRIRGKRGSNLKNNPNVGGKRRSGGMESRKEREEEEKVEEEEKEEKVEEEEKEENEEEEEKEEYKEKVEEEEKEENEEEEEKEENKENEEEEEKEENKENEEEKEEEEKEENKENEEEKEEEENKENEEKEEKEEKVENEDELRNDHRSHTPTKMDRHIRDESENRCNQVKMIPQGLCNKSSSNVSCVKACSESEREFSVESRIMLTSTKGFHKEMERAPTDKFEMEGRKDNGIETKTEIQERRNKKDIAVATNIFVESTFYNNFKKEIANNLIYNFYHEEYEAIMNQLPLEKKQPCEFQILLKCGEKGEITDGSQKRELQLQLQREKKMNVQDWASKVCELVVRDTKGLFDSLILCNEDIEHLRNMSRDKKIYLDEISELKKKNKMLNDINERQTNQLLQLSCQISSNIKNDFEVNEQNFLHEKIDYMEKEIKQLQGEKVTLESLANDKLACIKKNYELKCFLKTLENVVHKKSQACISLKREKQELQEKLKLYFENLQLAKEDLNMYKLAFLENQRAQKHLAYQFKNLLRTHSKTARCAHIGSGTSIAHSKMQKIKGLKKTKKLKKMNHLKILRQYVLGEEHPIVHSMKICNVRCNVRCNFGCNVRCNFGCNFDCNFGCNFGCSCSGRCSRDPRGTHNATAHSESACGQRIDVHEGIAKRRSVSDTPKENISNYDSLTKEELAHKVRMYELVLDEWKSVSIKNKSKNDTELKETKKLLSQERAKNALIEKKYQSVLKEITIVSEETERQMELQMERQMERQTGRQVEWQTKQQTELQTSGKEELLKYEGSYEYRTCLKIQALLNEINFLTKEIERLREDQLLLQEGVKNKSEIISHLIKRHALSEEHFRLDTNLSISKDKLTYEEMWKIMEETLIENIRLRSDLLTLAKSVQY